MRRATIDRETDETTIHVDLTLDGDAAIEVDTGIAFFDHMLEALATHGRFDLEVSARGDFDHHIAEDAMIALGQAVTDALGDKSGIRRAGHAMFPMDDALALVAIDLSGRPYAAIDVSFNDTAIVDLEADLYVHLLETFAHHAACNLHVDLLRGENDHHKAEAIAKGVGRALDDAVTIVGEGIPSAKGHLE